MARTTGRSALVLVVTLIAGCLAGPDAASPSPAPPTQGRTPTPVPSGSHVTASAVPTRTPAPTLTSAALREAVSLSVVRRHLEALQAIADRHGGTRATGTPGFTSSAAYVSDQLADLGYGVEEQAVDAAGQPSANILTERSGTAAKSRVVMIGAHLDSVAAGPGINDNGSGVAVLLAVAEALASLPPPQRTVRLAFWGAEEGGPFGSSAYVASLDDAERYEIAAYLNFDMLGSPNPIRFVYAEPSAAPGSEALTDLFAAHFDELGLPWEPIDLAGDSDHGPFVEAGIPTGGLFSGGIEPVSPAQAERFGAAAGQPSDPCSHAACDSIANLGDPSLDVMADAVAHAVATLAAGGT
jgi:aminopeptidase S